MSSPESKPEFQRIIDGPGYLTPWYDEMYQGQFKRINLVFRKVTGNDAPKPVLSTMDDDYVPHVIRDSNFTEAINPITES